MPFIVKKLLVVLSFFEIPEDLIAIQTKKRRDLELLVIDDMIGEVGKVYSFNYEKENVFLATIIIPMTFSIS